LGLKPLQLKKGSRGTLLDQAPFHLATESLRRIRFSPDWSMMIEGESRLRLENRSDPTRNSDLPSDLLILRLPDATAEHRLSRDDLRRTPVVMRREKGAWSLYPEADRDEAWSLEYDDGTFARIEIEGGESRNGLRHTA